MENASKALIIAAAVLIAIVLVALGVLLLGNVSDTSKQAQTVGNSISNTTGKVTSSIISSMKEPLKLASVAKVGESVEYIPEGSAHNSEGEGCKFEADSEEGEWKIFKIESGCVYLIRTSSVGNLTLTGNLDFVEMENLNDNILNKICQEYGNEKYVIEARAPKLSDINTPGFEHGKIFWINEVYDDRIVTGDDIVKKGLYFWDPYTSKWNTCVLKETRLYSGNSYSKTYRCLPSYKTKRAGFR